MPSTLYNVPQVISPEPALPASGHGILPNVSLFLRKTSAFVFFAGLVPFIIAAIETRIIVLGLGLLPLAASSLLAVIMVNRHSPLVSASSLSTRVNEANILLADLILFVVYIPFIVASCVELSHTFHLRVPLGAYCASLLCINAIIHASSLAIYYVQRSSSSETSSLPSYHQNDLVETYHDDPNTHPVTNMLASEAVGQQTAVEPVVEESQHA